MYNVVLHKQNAVDCPYILDIDANTEQRAIEVAKQTIAKIAYWGLLEYEPIETRISKLVIDRVTLVEGVK